MTTMNTTTTIDQLTQSHNGFARLSAMTGAHTFINHGDAVSFKFKGSRAANYCKITLTPADVYTVTIGKIRKWELTKAQTVDGVFADSLKQVFETATGLYLSL